MRSLAAILVCLLLVACAGVEMKPGKKSHARRDIPPGPGILTGEEGEFVLFRLEGEPSEEEAVGEGEAGKDEEAAKDGTSGQAPKP